MLPSLALLGVLALAVALLLVPFGLPGVWVMIAVLGAAALPGAVPWATWAILAAVAGAAELAEFWLLSRLGARYGGSRRAFWGAVLGGVAGLFVGVPLPLVGPIVTTFLGSFVGAALVTLAETSSPGHAARVGWGVLLARTVSVVLKVGVGLVILVVGAWELLFR